MNHLNYLELDLLVPAFTASTIHINIFGNLGIVSNFNLQLSIPNQLKFGFLVIPKKVSFEKENSQMA